MSKIEIVDEAPESTTLTIRATRGTEGSITRDVLTKIGKDKVLSIFMDIERKLGYAQTRLIYGELVAMAGQRMTEERAQQVWRALLGGGMYNAAIVLNLALNDGDVVLIKASKGASKQAIERFASYIDQGIKLVMLE